MFFNVCLCNNKNLQEKTTLTTFSSSTPSTFGDMKEDNQKRPKVFRIKRFPWLKLILEESRFMQEKKNLAIRPCLPKTSLSRSYFCE